MKNLALILTLMFSFAIFNPAKSLPNEPGTEICIGLYVTKIATICFTIGEDQDFPLEICYDTEITVCKGLLIRFGIEDMPYDEDLFEDLEDYDNPGDLDKVELTRTITIKNIEDDEGNVFDAVVQAGTIATLEGDGYFYAEYEKQYH